MVLEEKEKKGGKSFGRWIEPNEIVIEDLSEPELLKVQEDLEKDGYHSEYWKAEKQESGHLHIKNLPHLEELTKGQLQKYKELFIKKYVPSQLLKSVDFQLCGEHRIAKENSKHYKGYGIKQLIKETNKAKPNFCDKELFDLAKEEKVVSSDVSSYEDLINQIEPYWIEGKRQNLAMSLSGYLRKNERLGIQKVKEIITALCNLTQDKEIGMRLKAVEETFKKDEENIKGYTGLKEILQEEKIKEKNPINFSGESLELKRFNDYKNLKKDKNFIIQDMLNPTGLTLVYSPPAHFKSLVMSLDLGICVSKGIPFLKMKTKRTPTLLLDGENNNQIIKERWEGLHNGHNLKRGDYPLYILKQGNLINEKKQVNLGFMILLEKAIEEHKIKLLIFDTLHRFAFYDENKADDLNLLYVKVFQPLIEKYKLHIIFLHHTTKQGGYRGSSDLLGQVDNAYSLVRQKDKSNYFTIRCEKARSGEISDINGEIIFEENFIKILRTNEKQEKEKKLDKLKEVTGRIRGLFKAGMELKRKDIIDNLNLNEFEFGSIKTIDRALKFLIDNEYLDKNVKGVYSLILR